MARKAITIIRRWNDPTIKLWLNDEEIGVEMELGDFVTALADEAAEPLASKLAALVNPALLFSKGALEKRLIESIEDVGARAIFAEAAEKVLREAKSQTHKLV